MKQISENNEEYLEGIKKRFGEKNHKIKEKHIQQRIEQSIQFETKIQKLEEKSLDKFERWVNLRCLSFSTSF